MEKISVIVPIYNTATTLRGCINSIIKQKYTNLEIILVDDGSTDQSEEICKEIANLDNRIFYYKKENGGLADARNYGITKSTGNYLSFIDSDDQIDINFYSTLVEMLNKYNADIASSSFLKYFDESELCNVKIKSNKKEIVLKKDEIIKEYLNPKKNRIISHGACLKLFKKDLFNNISFEKGKLHEDLFIMYQLLNKCTKYVHVFHKYYYYYQNKNSITHNFKEKNIIDIYDAMQNQLSYFSNNNLLTNDSVCLAIEQFNYCLYAYTIARFKVNYVPQIEKMRLFLKKHISKSSLSFRNKVINRSLFIITNAIYNIKRGNNV